MDDHLTYWRGSSFYINPTSRCTNRCLFCVRNFEEEVFGFNLRLNRDPEPEEISKTIQETWNDRFDEAVVVGFGEPLLNLETTLEAVRTVRRISNVSIRINTNGQALLLYPGLDVSKELHAAGVDMVQVSLNAQDEESYMKLCCPQFGRSAFDSILEFAKRCSTLMKIVISAVSFPGIDMDIIQEIAARMGAGFRLRHYHGPQEVVDTITRLLAGKNQV
jgi:cyclic pyranopterin phosphate synthase